MRAADAALLGLLHGPAELLPVSSSAHVAVVRRVLGHEVTADRSVEVALHAGSAAALAIGWRPSAVSVVAAVPPGIVGVLGEKRFGPSLMPAGLVAGGVALAAADRSSGTRAASDARLTDGLWFGVAQACALVPGVSRSGAVLAAARWRGFSRPAAAELSLSCGVPVTLGAAAFTARRGSGPLAPLAVGAGVSFAATLAARRLVRLLERPLWPWAAYRMGLAGVEWHRGATSTIPARD
jgi:undecaprenyl-diphosphatase